ncbi:hypothetical protein Salat_2910700 [Sesamum alatum]|uniref:Uncharacterized protein n=1 Tax=Sesamum alatum TaxID=300844 RepID=A0AAE1XJL6_9LAMI|nr:hypothetical protein Salat_2910700 [Sesamum alatum]
MKIWGLWRLPEDIVMVLEEGKKSAGFGGRRANDERRWKWTRERVTDSSEYKESNGGGGGQGVVRTTGEKYVRESRLQEAEWLLTTSVGVFVLRYAKKFFWSLVGCDPWSW